MNNFPWFVKHKNILRGTILLALFISLLGPWTFDLINVPEEYTCSPPNVRLYGDFCGVPLTGVQVFGLYIVGFFYMLLEMIKGTFGSRFRELLVMLYILPLIPFLTTFFSIWKKETRRLLTISLVAWLLALISTLTLFIFQINRQALWLWGLRLYIVVSVIAVILEITVMKTRSNE